MPLFWLFYCRASLYSKMLEVFVLSQIFPNYREHLWENRSYTYHEEQTTASEVHVSMLLSLPGHFTARMLGFVQPDLGSTASITGWRRADLRTSAGNLDCCTFSPSRSHLHITHEHKSGGTLSLSPLRTSYLQGTTCTGQEWTSEKAQED